MAIAFEKNVYVWSVIGIAIVVGMNGIDGGIIAML